MGETHEEMYRILDSVVPHLPVNKPTYLMGVGTPANILEAVSKRCAFFSLCISKPKWSPRTCVYKFWQNQFI